jgi:hypothetical protein
MVTGIRLFESPEPTLSDLKFTKEGWIQETNWPLAFWMLLPPTQRNVKLNSDKLHAIFTHKLQRALRLTVGFSKMYCEL